MKKRNILSMWGHTLSQALLMAAFYEKGFTQDSIGNEKSSILFIEEMITTYTQSSYWCNVWKMLFWQQFSFVCVFVNQTSLNLSVLFFLRATEALSLFCGIKVCQYISQQWHVMYKVDISLFFNNNQYACSTLDWVVYV